MFDPGTQQLTRPELTAMLCGLLSLGCWIAAVDPVRGDDLFDSEPFSGFRRDSVALGDEDEPEVPPKPGLLPESEERPLPPQLTKPLPAAIRLTVAASKMTVRRDPDPQRLIGDESENGISIVEVQKELIQDSFFGDAPIEGLAPFRSSQLSWSNEPPYGKYIYIHHDPLLFEDIPTERYGEQFPDCVQPLASFCRFVSTVPMLPYKLTVNYHAARDDDALIALDHHGNPRPGVTDGAYFPDFYLGAPYPKARGCGYLMEAATVAGILVFLP